MLDAHEQKKKRDRDERDADEPHSSTPSSALESPVSASTHARCENPGDMSRPRADGREHRLWLNFVQIPGDRPVGIDLGRRCKARWSYSEDPDLFAGLSISTDPNVATFALRSFKINYKRLELACGDDTGFLCVRLFVRTHQTLIHGVTRLPTGAMLTLESVCDTITVIGEGSWYLRIAP